MWRVSDLPDGLAARGDRQRIRCGQRIGSRPGGLAQGIGALFHDVVVAEPDASLLTDVVPAQDDADEQQDDEQQHHFALSGEGVEPFFHSGVGVRQAE